MSTPIAVSNVGPGVRQKVPQAGPSSAPSQNARNRSSEKKPNVHKDHHSQMQALVYHPPQSKFPIRVCSVYQCGVVLTRHGEGPLCQRHRVEVEMASKVNPYPDSQSSQQRQQQHFMSQSSLSSHRMPRRINPYPEVRTSRHGKERERDTGAGSGRSASIPIALPSSITFGKALQQVDMDGQPQHQLHALTALQRSLLAQSDGASFSPSHRQIPILPNIHRPRPTPPTRPVIPNDGPMENLPPQSMETATSNRRPAQNSERTRALTITVPPLRRINDSAQKRASSNPPILGKERESASIPQYPRKPPVKATSIGKPFPFAGDAYGRTIYTPDRRLPAGGMPMKGLAPHNVPMVSPLYTTQPLEAVDAGESRRRVASTPAPIPGSQQLGGEGGSGALKTHHRASSLPLPTYRSSEGDVERTTLLGKRKRGQGGSSSEKEGLKRRHSLRAVSEPLPSPVAGVRVFGWQENMNVDVKEPKKEPGLRSGMDLVAAVGTAIHDALSTIDLSGLELVYPPEEQPHGFTQLRPSNPYPVIPDKDMAISGPQSLTKKTTRPSAHANQSSAIASSSRSHGLPTPPSTDFQSRHAHAQARPPPILLPIPGSRHRADFVPALRACSTMGCAGLIKGESTSKRCYKCVMSSWKARKPAFLPRPTTTSTNAPSPSPTPSGLTSLLKRSEKASGPRKSVTWADGWKSDEEDMGDEERQAIEEDMLREGGDIPGWDSDLTDLSSSEESEEDESEEDESDAPSDDTDVPPIISLPSGLKIRLPARPRVLPSTSDPATIVDETASVSNETTDCPTNSDSSSLTLSLDAPGPTIVESETSVIPTNETTEPPIGFTSPSSPSVPTSTAEESANSTSLILTPHQSGSPPPETVLPTIPTSKTSPEPERKPTSLPRIRISLSQLSNLKASSSVSSSSSSSPSSSSSSSTLITSSSPTPTSTRPPSPSASSTTPAEPAITYEPDPSGRKCAIRKCRRALPAGYTWKCCPPCRTHHREYQRKRLGCSERYVGNEYDRIKSSSVSSKSSKRLKSPSLSESKKKSRSSSPTTTEPETPTTPVSVFEPTSLRNFAVRGPDNTIIDMHNLLVSGARLCTIRSCKHILPGPDDYKWKMCHPCRERTTRTRRIRQIKAASRGLFDPSAIDDDVGALPPLLPDLNLISKGRCPNLDCGVRLEKDTERDEDGFAECSQCSWRKMSSEERKANPVELHDLVLVVPSKSQTNDGEEAGETQSSRQKSPSNPYPRLPEKTRAVAPYPEYLSLSRLLARFQELFAHFLQAQSYYLSMSEAQNDLARGRRIAKFSFDGEYSMVAPDFSVLRREKEVAAIVNNVRHEIERLARLKFDPSTRVTTVAYGGLLTRYACQNQVPISLPVPVPQQKAYLKSMRGELEVVVVPADSHTFIPGQRTVVRFRLVG
ncbi:hypothetical protein PM082_013923 [Marasmius tenuissimus]|nr:hypothetical protein PM082_013923 [Marasmius tenuissimus]